MEKTLPGGRGTVDLFSRKVENGLINRDDSITVNREFLIET